ncbi:MAG: hypothetical protein CM15mP55_1730 [Hyphomicrobiales bacterium]|nr:MAG: hypothetical protein CM15mP55_1730 [Hyphomicrobiales bacterium]
MDEPLCELETDKVTIEVPAQSAGVLEEVLFEEGATVEVGALLGSIDAEGTPAAPAETPAAEAPTPEPSAPAEPVAPAAPPAAETQSDALAPSVRRLVSEHGLSPADIAATGKDGRLTKGDVLAAVSGQVSAPASKHLLPELHARPAPTKARARSGLK